MRVYSKTTPTNHVYIGFCMYVCRLFVIGQSISMLRFAKKAACLSSNVSVPLVFGQKTEKLLSGTITIVTAKGVTVGKHGTVREMFFAPYRLLWHKKETYAKGFTLY